MTDDDSRELPDMDKTENANVNLWRDASRYWKELQAKRISELFNENENRFEEYSVDLNGLLFDYSKTKIDETAKKLLIEIARQVGVEQKREAMLAGEKINNTENRAVGHVALRNVQADPFLIDGQDVMSEVHSVLSRMKTFASRIRDGSIRSSSDEPFTDIVNIGIGGSDLGPAMAARALSPYGDGPRVHFVSNIDSAHITDTLKGLNLCRTLFLVASKTFTTIETITNAETAKRQLIKAVGEDNASQHFAAISSSVEKAINFGVSEERIFGYRDWVGGRFSVWGPIGLPLMINIGPDNFDSFLKGAHAVDQHFRSTQLDRNMPVLMALVDIWHNNICGYKSRALVPYDQRLEKFTSYIQQLDMESSGKTISAKGAPVIGDTGPVVWGQPGTNGQHAFFQLIHQGSQIIPTEFLIACKGHEPELMRHHNLLVANALAQSEALMSGRTREEALQNLLDKGETEARAEELAAHKTFPGDRPSTILLYPQLNPYRLGQIIALYEHRVFVEGCIWDINSFDQWGVELGKELAKDLYPYVAGEKQSEDITGKSTAGLLNRIALYRDS